ncbi:hypothetical protein [Oceanirhabdus sp. W0125-5]|uniref:hypothetical protein n=1 Tax=Oceanirhabdus sp. W0125-5 TaxID=2999116 RepID=UPI0022F33C87|nr:hypothetical protein [Oceanirhabdus sp. W0125-5]WBW98724.1 hypothetical protein OW730_08190 [Oceanirhabdus sp. W0125-5]
MVKKNLYENGFLIKERDCETIEYHGVQGYWPIDMDTEGIEINEKRYLDKYCDDNIYEPSNYDDTVGVCNDMEYLNRYLEGCIKAKIKVDILF